MLKRSPCLLLVFAFFLCSLAAAQKIDAETEKAMAERFNNLYRSPRQGNFVHDANAFLVAVAAKEKPGKALDVAMGQGRNAVYLATKGWDVTGFDIAEEGLKAAQESAAKAGVKIATVKANDQEFDYGRDKWDLIYFVYTNSSVADPAYVARITAALKKGGLVLVDRPYRSMIDPEPGWTETPEDKPSALAKAWSHLQILFYQENMEVAEWQQTSTDRTQKLHRIVRLLARKL